MEGWRNMVVPSANVAKAKALHDALLGGGHVVAGQRVGDLRDHAVCGLRGVHRGVPPVNGRAFRSTLALPFLPRSPAPQGTHRRFWEAGVGRGVFGHPTSHGGHDVLEIEPKHLLDRKREAWKTRHESSPPNNLGACLATTFRSSKFRTPKATVYASSGHPRREATNRLESTQCGRSIPGPPLFAPHVHAALLSTLRPAR